jgi:hypothetical protein
MKKNLVLRTVFKHLLYHYNNVWFDFKTLELIKKHKSINQNNYVFKFIEVII